MDMTEWMDSVTLVSPAEADVEGLPCAYCSGEPAMGERLRAEAHERCRASADAYGVGYSREGAS